MVGACYLCESPTSRQCPTCPAFLCSDYCAALHTSTAGACLPYRVTTREGRGRVLVAARDVAPLELLVEEKAAALGPCQQVLLFCVNTAVARVAADCAALPGLPRHGGRVQLLPQLQLPRLPRLPLLSWGPGTHGSGEASIN